MYKIKQYTKMKDLMKVIKEANLELESLIEDKEKFINEIANDETKLKDFIQKRNDLAVKYHETVKEQVSLEFFSQLMIMDMLVDYGYVGGGIL